MTDEIVAELILTWAGTTLAGAAYGIVVLLVTSLISPGSDGGEMVFVGGFVGGLIAGVAGLGIIPLLAIIRRSLRMRPKPIVLGAVGGGLTGFVTTAMLLLSGPAMDGLPGFLRGPGIATIFGQIGGALGGYWVIRTQPNALQLTDSHDPVGRFRFGIYEPLVLFVWVSIFLAGLRLKGIDLKIACVASVVWLVYQTATFLAGWFFCGRIWPWLRHRLRVRNRST
jgi:hypothetical protein